MEYTLEPKDVAKQLTKFYSHRKKKKEQREFKGRHIDDRRADGSLPEFLYQRNDGNWFYAPETAGWLHFIYRLKATEHTGATYVSMKEIFAKAIETWGAEKSLECLKNCFTPEPPEVEDIEDDLDGRDFRDFLRCLLDNEISLSSELAGYSSKPKTEENS